MCLIAFTGLIIHEEICVDLNKDASTETYCPKGYLDFTNTGLSFDPERNECSEQYRRTRVRLIQECKDEDDESQTCSLDLSTGISAKPKCFQLYEFRIRHTCERIKIDSTKAQDTTTIVSDITSKEDIIAADESTTVVTSVRYSGTAKKSTTVSLDIISIEDSGAGLVASLVVAGLFLICLVILIVYLVIRHINRRGSNKKVRNELRENDYIGSQDIALPQTGGRSNQQHVGMYGQRSSSNTTTNTQINNDQHTCSNFETHNEFQSHPYAARRDETFADNQISNGDEYAMIGPIAETSFSETIHSRTETSDSALLSEPTVTGLNRTQLAKTGYEFAKPVLETENKIDDEDQYALSEEGVYDHSRNTRHKELEVNIYNHAVDTIYDSGSHKRNDDEREDTYDHFFGQKTEDDYDITTTT
ncbi:Hypothetical predicted protein [Mytilus galloprovincialis]|uniref:Uncharacterized protein n=1 Tax=Mytilus galloprovincialis TaxID=29158 RepID=A0A8B6C8R1_MYTGA|nr:Hypothetical predicted protein [Mytilus galloprovincialis]